MLLICHDLLLAPLWVDAAVVIDQGRIVTVGPPGDVLQADLLHRVFAANAESLGTTAECRRGLRSEKRRRDKWGLSSSLLWTTWPPELPQFLPNRSGHKHTKGVQACCLDALFSLLNFAETQGIWTGQSG